MTPTMQEVARWLREAALSERAISLACSTGVLPARFKHQADERADLFDSRSDQVEAMGWRPISECPKSGTYIDLWDSSAQKRLTDFRWDGNNRWVRWGENSFGVMAWCVVKGRITHFMAIPQPPVKE